MCQFILAALARTFRSEHVRGAFDCFVITAAESEHESSAVRSIDAQQRQRYYSIAGGKRVCHSNVIEIRWTDDAKV